MKLYASSEKEQKNACISQKNPKVVLYWYKQIPEEEYIAIKMIILIPMEFRSKGTAKLMDPASEEAQKAAALYLETLYGAEGWAAMGEKQPAIITKLLEVNDWIEIDPTEYVVNSLQWSYNKEGKYSPGVV